MLFFEQLDFFSGLLTALSRDPRRPRGETAADGASLVSSGRDRDLEEEGRKLLRQAGALQLIPRLRVEWSRRLRSSAGRAIFDRALVLLNPLLREHGREEIERTLKHELAHLLAQARVGRRRISPHGSEWRQACSDLGIAGEARCHTLPFPTQKRSRPYLYRCPECEQDFPRVRRLRRKVACLACCRRFNRGRYDGKFRLQLVRERALP